MIRNCSAAMLFKCSVLLCCSNNGTGLVIAATESSSSSSSSSSVSTSPPPSAAAAAAAAAEAAPPSMPSSSSQVWWMALAPTFVSPNDTSVAPTGFSHFPFRCQINEGASLKEHSVCLRRDRSLWSTVQRGRDDGIAECVKVMKDNPWNCFVNRNTTKLFGEVVLNGTTREGAFLHALMTAAVIRSVARACGKGYLADRCPCAQHDGTVPYNSNGARSWEWGNCSVNMVYGRQLVRKLANPPNAKRQNQLRPRPLLQILNNAAGELALEAAQRINCRCHGLTSSCALRTCFMITPDLGLTATALALKYPRAERVVARRGSDDWRPLAQLARAVKQRSTSLNISRLHYTHDSPDFCRPDPALDIPGTRGRTCSLTVGSAPRCSKLCCGRRPGVRELRRKYCSKWGKLFGFGLGRLAPRCTKYGVRVYRSYYCS